jgi:ankyrin repeat protein
MNTRSKKDKRDVAWVTFVRKLKRIATEFFRSPPTRSRLGPSRQFIGIINASSFLCVLASCSHNPRPDQVILSYSVDAAMCMNCPSFKVDFQSGGQVHYECASGCAVPGEQYYSVPPQQFADLAQAFQQENFFEIPRTDSFVFDAAVFRLTYRDDRRIYEVVDDFRQNAALTRLETRFRTAVDAGRFEKPSVDLYRRLVNSGWNVNTVAKDQQNALTSAVSHNDIESARFLVENGSAVTMAAVSFAAMGDNLVEFRLLLPPSAIKSGSQLAKYSAINTARSKNTALLRYVLDIGVSPDQREPINGLTPLLNATENGRIENTVLLLDRGADPNVADTYGRPPLWYAANATNTAFIQVLLQHGANVNAVDNYGETALMNATRVCYYWDMEALLKASADPTLRNKRGKTARDWNFLPEPKCVAAQKLIIAAQNSWLLSPAR